MTKYFLYLCFIFTVSCSSTEEKQATKNYSDETNRAFEMIERGGSYYLKKSPSVNAPTVPQVTAPTKVVAPQEVTRKKIQEDIVIDEKINYKEPKEAATPSKASERLIEINQNLAFYCMKHRKDATFKNSEAVCMDFVNSVMEACQKQHASVNSKLLNCIQNGLKKRR